MMYMYVQVKKRVIRGLARIATGKEAVTISRHANDDGIPKRTASDGRTSNPFEVNLCKKEEVLRLALGMCVGTINQLGMLELLLDEMKRIDLKLLLSCVE